MPSSQNTSGAGASRSDEGRVSGGAGAPRGWTGRLSAAGSLLVAGGPASLVRRAHRFFERRREEKTPVQEAFRAWLDRNRPGPRELRLLARAVAALPDLPLLDVATLGGAGGGPAGEKAPGIEEALPLYPRAASAIALPRDATGEEVRGALSRSRADWVLFLLEGWTLRPDALLRIALALRDRPGVLFLFGDEEIETGGPGGALPLLKPGWSPELFRAAFYVGWPVGVRRREALARADRLSGRGAAAVYELLLRLHETPGAVLPVSSILARRAAPPAPPAGPGLETDGDEAMRRALATWAAERFPGASVLPGRAPGSWRLRRARSGRPGVSVIVPTRDGVEWLRRCIPSALRERPLEILIVDNGSRGAATLDYLGALEKDGAARVLPFPGRFNFSAMMNAAARAARGEFLLFLNDDTEVLEPGSIDAMAEEAESSDVGAVGALLLYPDGAIQHAGLVVGMGVVAGHVFRGLLPEGNGCFVSPLLPREVSAVDGACFLVRKSLFLELGGFDAEGLPVSFADVDFCLRAREKGRRTVYTPHAVFLHHESRTRAPVLDQREVVRMERRWGRVLTSDPFYHPALSLLGESPRPRLA
ncbi:MAG: glycosyltransferase [Candidatus Latescibacterota bacterium]|nr:MAG: glycosyltransferase [Candidatus Latescibacterota bacterium]